ncbi:phytoene/squalene synthase family protein [Candidatus Uhrbacteria bacterium]|nr:phytoene/squalene synthase family protein [Candidatus Uhrbacteria bacterium]
MTSELQRAYRECQRIHAKHGKSYYFATRFFPKDLRYATYALYAFFRLPDEMVDNPAGRDPKAELERFRDEWRSGVTTNPVIMAARDTFERYKIPFQYSGVFLDAMIQDTWKTTYSTYAELEQYMYGSAAVVGLMMSHVIGFKPGALAYAEKLGYAMQLTNFLRDIREDKEKRGRVYMPQDELARFADDHVAFMKFQIARADALYDEANRGIPLLEARGRFAVRAASDLYRAILRKIEQQNYDVTLRARTSFVEKIFICLRAKFTV